MVAYFNIDYVGNPSSYLWVQWKQFPCSVYGKHKIKKDCVVVFPYILYAKEFNAELLFNFTNRVTAFIEVKGGAKKTLKCMSVSSSFWGP
jgi:hypothetical protein